MTIVNKSDYDTKDIKRLLRIVLKALKKSFVFPPLETLIVQSYDSARWEGHYDGKKSITVRIGRKVRYPNTWDKIVELPTWEDLFVGLLTWCACLHYQKACWSKKPEPEQKKTRKYRRTDCQEVTVWILKRWRVNDAYNLILEKANAHRMHAAE